MLRTSSVVNVNDACLWPAIPVFEVVNMRYTWKKVTLTSLTVVGAPAATVSVASATVI